MNYFIIFQIEFILITEYLQKLFHQLSSVFGWEPNPCTAWPVYIWLQAWYRSRAISLNLIEYFGRCLVNPILEMAIFRQLQLEFASAIPDLNGWKIEANNSAAKSLN